MAFESARLGRPWEIDEEFIIGMSGTHSTLVKLPEHDNDDYDNVHEVLAKFAAVAAEVIDAHFRMVSSTYLRRQTCDLASSQSCQLSNIRPVAGDEEKPREQKLLDRERRGQFPSHPCDPTRKISTLTS